MAQLDALRYPREAHVIAQLDASYEFGGPDRVRCHDEVHAIAPRAMATVAGFGRASRGGGLFGDAAAHHGRPA